MARQREREREKEREREREREIERERERVGEREGERLSCCRGTSCCKARESSEEVVLDEEF